MNPPYRRAILGVALSLLMLGAVPSVVLAAQPSCGDTLLVNTTLTANLDCSGYNGTALTMGAPDIVLNLNGKTITGPAGDEGWVGVDTNSYNRTTIRNGKINHYRYGVLVNDSNKTVVKGIQMLGENNNDYGVFMTYSNKSVLKNLNISGVRYGVKAEYGAQNTIMTSTLQGDLGNGMGLWLYQEARDTVSGNQFRGYEGVYDYGSQRTVYTANASNNNTFGYYTDCDGQGTVVMTNNTANGNSTYGFYANSCYTLDHPIDDYIGSRFVGNSATNGGGYGFYTEYSYNELWRENVSTDNGSNGFYFWYPSTARIVYNTSLRNDNTGFYVGSNYTYYNVDRISFNTARRNANYGFFADFGAPGDANVSKLNTPNYCYNVDC